MDRYGGLFLLNEEPYHFNFGAFQHIDPAHFMDEATVEC